MNFRIAIHRILRYLRYWLLCANEHSLQSTFAYGLFTKALKGRLEYVPESTIESKRTFWQNSEIVIDEDSFGVHSTVAHPKLVSQIAKSGLSSISVSSNLCGMIDYFDCTSVLELGTSLGINTAYMSRCPNIQELVTVDANKELIGLAKDILHDADIQIELINADVQDAIVNLFQRNKIFDFVFIDANHSYESTISYFEKLKHLIHDESVMVFDDINWSPHMTKAWNKIRTDAHVTMTIENYQLGIVFFNTKLPKKAFILEF